MKYDNQLERFRPIFISTSAFSSIFLLISALNIFVIISSHPLVTRTNDADNYIEEKTRGAAVIVILLCFFVQFVFVSLHVVLHFKFRTIIVYYFDRVRSSTNFSPISMSDMAIAKMWLVTAIGFCAATIVTCDVLHNIIAEKLLLLQ